MDTVNSGQSCLVSRNSSLVLGSKICSINLACFRPNINLYTHVKSGIQVRFGNYGLVWKTFLAGPVTDLVVQVLGSCLQSKGDYLKNSNTIMKGKATCSRGKTPKTGSSDCLTIGACQRGDPCHTNEFWSHSFSDFLWQHGAGHSNVTPILFEFCPLPSSSLHLLNVYWYASGYLFLEYGLLIVALHRWNKADVFFNVIMH